MWLRTVGLAAHELAHNPDGQRQFGPDGAPVGALSDPVAVYADEDRVLVADAGANAVLEVNARTGDVSTFFVPPVVTPEEVAGCDRPGNDPGTVGCDPVPAGVTEGEDGLVYVSTLGAGVQGAGRVYVLNQLGHEVRRLEGFTSPTGIAVDCEGVVTVSELLEGLPAGQPGPGFDPSTVGQVVRVGRIGDRTYAQVTMPTGLVIEDGQLYASAWSGGSVMVPSAGQVVRVGADTFGPLPAQ
jgi:sugar lactone lactonase YvrE